MKWLVSTGRVRIEGKPKRSRLKPVWLSDMYNGLNKCNHSDCFTRRLKGKHGVDVTAPVSVDLEVIYWDRIPGKRMTPAFMKYVLKEYGYDLKL
jgi:hypothetical protein